MLYLVLFFLATGLLFLDAGRVGLSLSVLEATSAVAATLGNVGPGFGPMGSYLDFSPASKVFMVALMWLGRLESCPCWSA